MFGVQAKDSVGVKYIKEHSNTLQNKIFFMISAYNYSSISKYINEAVEPL